jgi:macrolide transport system ATP-binding/permease protein
MRPATHVWFESVLQDLRFALRAMRRAPGFTLVAILTLALGIGANTAIFSIVEAIFLRPLPVDDPGGLVLFSPDPFYGTMSDSTPPSGVWQEFSSDSYESLRTARLPLQGVAAYSGNGNDTITLRRLDQGAHGSVAAPDATVRGTAHLVSGNYFDVMGAHPEVGRALTPDDDRPGAPAVIVVSHRFWETTLGANAQAIGSPLLLNHLPVTIVGVMPAEFFGERVRLAPDAWVPLVWQPQVQQRDALRDKSNEYWLGLIGRLGAGETQTAAESAATTALRRFLTDQAGASIDAPARTRIARTSIAMASGARGIPDVAAFTGHGFTDVRKNDAAPLMLLLAAVGLVLLVACANVATLLLARARARKSEIAVRRALGAGRGRLVRQWLTESALLGAIGTGAGLLLAHWLAPTLQSYFPIGPLKAALNVRVLLFATSLALISIFLVGIVPAVRAGRADPVDALRGSGRSTRGRSRAFGAAEPIVIAEIAVSLVLVLGAVLFTRTLVNVEREPLGFDQDNVLLVQMDPRTAGYTPDNVLVLYRRLYDRVAALPGVVSATFARFSPFSGSLSSFAPDVEGYTPPSGKRERVEAVEVGPNYPQTIGMPILQGRAIDLRDVDGSTPVAMVNEAFARHFYPGASPVGHHVSFDQQQFEIVGIVKDALFHDARDQAVPFIFTPMLQEHTRMAMNCELEFRTSGDARAIAAAVRQAVNDTDSRVIVTRARTMREQVLATFGPERLAAGFVGAFAVLALLLAAVGLYGVVSHSVAGRTNEIGVRVALGATAADIVWLVLRETVVWLAIGLGLGAFGAEAAGHLVSNQLFGVASGDVVSLMAAAAALSIVAIGATLVPAGRALRVHPAAALRSE